MCVYIYIYIYIYIYTGASIPPETMMHFPPLFKISLLFSKKFQTEENFHNFTFSRKISWFSSVKISDNLLFLVIDHKFRLSPLFSLFQYIFLLFRENYHFPHTLTNFPPVLDKFTCFLHTLRVFRSPPTLTTMHLCITRCTYWTPLNSDTKRIRNNGPVIDWFIGLLRACRPISVGL